MLIKFYRCLNTKESKNELCNSLLNSNDTQPYYYSYNNITNIIYLTHISDKTDTSRRGIIINSSNINYPLINSELQNKKFLCDNEADFMKKTITYYDKYRIEIPLNNDDTLILNSMSDMKMESDEQTNHDICKIYDETMKIAKPMEVI